MFENHQKCRIWSFGPIKIELSANTRPQASSFQKLAKIDHFGIFDEFCALKM